MSQSRISKTVALREKTKDNSGLVERLYKYKKAHEDKVQELKKKKEEAVPCASGFGRKSAVSSPPLIAS